MSKCNSCIGACCKDFTLPVSPMQFAFERKRKKSRWFEGHQIADMVIFLREDQQEQENSNGRKTMRHMPRLYHYTCKHFNTDTKLCMDYENRPHMCRDFPNHGVTMVKPC